MHRSSLVPTNKGFVGVALPLELKTFFEVINIVVGFLSKGFISFFILFLCNTLFPVLHSVG